MIHYSIEAADIAENEIEQAIWDQALHKAYKVFGEWNSPISRISLHGLKSLSGNHFRVLYLEKSDSQSHTEAKIFVPLEA